MDEAEAPGPPKPRAAPLGESQAGFRGPVSPLDVRKRCWRGVQAAAAAEEPADRFMGRADSFMAVACCTMRI